MTSDVIRALSDQKLGGAARAFECLLKDFRVSTGKTCGHVTRTLRGMRSHQWLVHSFRPQTQLFEKESGCSATKNPTAS